MRLPTLSSATQRVVRTESFLRRGAVSPSVCNTQVPCGPGFTCPNNCACTCDPNRFLTYDAKFLGNATHVGCVCG
jgi:hypothetical protein